MQLRTRTLPYAFIALLTLATACGGGDDDTGTDPNTNTGNPSAAEVQGMTSALQALFIGGAWFDVSSGEALAAQIAAQSGSTTFDNTVPCPGGGTTRAQGTVSSSVSGQNVTVSGNVTSTFSSCKATGNGTVFTFDGSGLTLNLDLQSGNGGYTYDFHEQGNISWAGNGKSGTCAINLTIHASYSGSGIPSATVSGSFCGQSIS